MKRKKEMAMEVSLKICDLCRGENLVRLAKISYTGKSGEEYHACSTHAKDIKKYKIPIDSEFDYPGDADGDRIDQ